MEHFEESKRLVRSTAGTLKLAIATGRREHLEQGAASDEVWSTIDALADELVWRLGLLEAAERAAGLRGSDLSARFARVFGTVPPAPRRA